MSSGPEHYAKGDHIAAVVTSGGVLYTTEGTVLSTADALALAQVHATLALAAATALERLELDAHTARWLDVAS